MNITGRQQAPLDHLREKPQRQGVAASEAALLPSSPVAPLFAAHRESSPMLVTYFPVFRSLRDDAAGAGALLLLALLAGALHAAPQLLLVDGDDEVSTPLVVARRCSGRRRDAPLNT